MLIIVTDIIKEYIGNLQNGMKKKKRTNQLPQIARKLGKNHGLSAHK